jgi:L-threonylcarbamoyladenylate synthase
MSAIYKPAVEALRRGGTVLYPTDTIWGLGCDATNEAAVERVYAFKQRPPQKALIVLLSDVGLLDRYLVRVPDIAWDLVEFAEKPLTVVYPQGKNVAPNLLGEDGSLAIRVVKDGFCRGLLQAFGKPLVSTSANLSGQPSPERFAQVPEELVKGVDYVLNGPENVGAPPSTIVRLGLNGEFEFLRK